MQMGVLWLVLMVVFIIIEAITMGLTTIWCAAGSLIAAIFAFLGFNLAVQIAVMVVVSIVCCIICIKWIRPRMNARTKGKENATNADRFLGETAVVIKTVNTLEGTGQVKVRGQVFSAKTADETGIIEEGAKVKVLSIEGVKLIVERIKED